jgi:hypothetical protein
MAVYLGFNLNSLDTVNVVPVGRDFSNDFIV